MTVKTITLTEFIQQQDCYIAEALAGKIFVYPTNTIYGIGGIVSPQTISAINLAKQRQSGKHYSIIAPSFQRIKDHCMVQDDIENQWNKLKQIHHNITILLPFQKTYTDAALVSSNTKIGVRHLGDHPMQQFVNQLNQPLITTSINISGQPPITSIDQIIAEQKETIDYVVDAGTINGSASVLIDSSDRSAVHR